MVVVVVVDDGRIVAAHRSTVAQDDGLNFAAVFDIFGFEHVFVVTQQPAGRQDRLLRQSADVEESIELYGRRCGVAQLR